MASFGQLMKRSMQKPSFAKKTTAAATVPPAGKKPKVAAEEEEDEEVEVTEEDADADVAPVKKKTAVTSRGAALKKWAKG